MPRLGTDLNKFGNIFASLVETGCESLTTPVGHKAFLLVHSGRGPGLGLELKPFYHKPLFLAFDKPACLIVCLLLELASEFVKLNKKCGQSQGIFE